MERKEVAVYLYLGVLIVASLLAVYFFNLQLTGFVVFEQNNQVAFNEGVYVNTLYNGSAVVLDVNQTSGTYTSKVFDAGNISTWNNLTWTGIGNPVFEVRSCSDSNCSNSSFSSGNLNNLNLSDQYFQYRVLFNTNGTNDTLSLNSVSLDYSPPTSQPTQVSIIILDPSGSKSSPSNIPIQFNISGGANYACWYGVYDASDSAVVVGNTNLVGCNNATFNLGAGNGNYIFNLYVNSSLGLQNKTSAFSLSISSNQGEEEVAPGEVPAPPAPPVQTVQSVTELSLQTIETSAINPLESRNFNLVASNTGNVPLSACELSVGGSSESWISVPDSSQNLNAGESKSFAFSMDVPEDTEEASYTFSLSVQCTETLKNSEFSVNVVKKRVDFNITDVQRTRQDRVRVSYELEELLDEEQTVELQFFLYDASNLEVANASANQTLSAGEIDDFNTNIAINESLSENMTLTLTANVNSQQYSISVREPITLGGAPTGFFVLGDDLGTTGNVLAIIILIVGVVAIFFFLKRRSISKKLAG